MDSLSLLMSCLLPGSIRIVEHLNISVDVGFIQIGGHNLLFIDVIDHTDQLGTSFTENLTDHGHRASIWHDVVGD